MRKKKGNGGAAVADAAARSDCTVPPALPKAELRHLLFRQSETEAQRISDYVEWQAHGEEKVLHAEKVASERVFGREYDVWDVHADKERWWVVTNPTNLYSQTLMPSLDYTLSFHIGLMARVAAHREPDGTEAQQEFLLVTTRKMTQAGEAFDQADEAEEFQAVGMQCRECLLALVREVIDGSDIGQGDDPPYKVTVAWRPDIGPAGEYVVRCESCGAVKFPASARQRKRKRTPPTPASDELPH
jgi:hypothetical protein